MTDHRLQALAPTLLNVTWHDNKNTYLTVTKKRGCLFLRVHRLFYDAPTPVLEALIQFAIKRDPHSRAVIKQMAHLHFSKTHVEAKPLKSRGIVYDLQEIFNRMLVIAPIENVTIGWSDRSRRGAFRSITFGTYDKHSRQIRINALLDNPQVPLYFLEFIVYHEMLHAVCHSKMNASGRCSVHTREFREKERQFPHFQKAKEWEKGSLKFFKKDQFHGRS